MLESSAQLLGSNKRLFDQAEIAIIMRVHGTDCRARQAESLEQARRTTDRDLRGLYTTIAKQWQLLAEQSQTRRAFAIDDSYRRPVQTDEAEHALVAQPTADPLAEFRTEAPANYPDQSIPADDTAAAVEDCREQTGPNDQNPVRQADYAPVENCNHLISSADLEADEVARTALQPLNDQAIAGADLRNAPDAVSAGEPQPENRITDSELPRGEEGELHSDAVESCSSPEIELSVASGDLSYSAFENANHRCAERVPAETLIDWPSEIIGTRSEQISRIDHKGEFARTDAKMNAADATSTGEPQPCIRDSELHPGGDRESSETVERWSSAQEIEVSVQPSDSDCKASENANNLFALGVPTATPIVWHFDIIDTRGEQTSRIDQKGELARTDADSLDNLLLPASHPSSVQIHPVDIANPTLQIIDISGLDQKEKSRDTPHDKIADGNKSYTLERVFSLWFGPWRR